MSKIIRPILFVDTSTGTVAGALPDIEVTHHVRDFRPSGALVVERTAADTIPKEDATPDENMDGGAASGSEDGSDPKDPDSSAIESVSDSETETSEKSTPVSVQTPSPELPPTVSLESSEPRVLAERVKALSSPTISIGKTKPPVAE